MSVLKKNDLDRIILNYPDVARKFNQEAERRVKETKEMEKRK